MTDYFRETKNTLSPNEGYTIDSHARARENGITDRMQMDAFRHSHTSAVVTHSYGEKLAEIAGESWPGSSEQLSLLDW